MIISVTEKHITTGRPGKCKLCPVALALTEAFGCEYSVALGEAYGNYLFRLPSAVQSAISTYDISGKMEPFQFELNLENANVSHL